MSFRRRRSSDAPGWARARSENSAWRAYNGPTAPSSAEDSYSRHRSQQRSRTTEPEYYRIDNHISLEPFLCDQILDFLVPCNSEGLFVDCTFGGGGHSRAILQRLSKSGSLLVLDVDPIAIAEAQTLASEDARIKVFHSAYSELEKVVRGAGKKLSGALFHLGTNEASERDPSRGMNHDSIGICDLRMNPSLGEPACDWLCRTTSEELAWVIREYGEDETPFVAARVSEAIVSRAKYRPLKTAQEIAELICWVKGSMDFKGRHPARSAFQAMRPHLNQEPQQLWAGLLGAFRCMKTGGRCVVIAHNRWECILVRRFCRYYEDYDKTHSVGCTLERLTQLYPLLSTDQTWAVKEVCSPIHLTPSQIIANKKSRSACAIVLEKVLRHSAQSTVYWHTGEYGALERALFTRPEKVSVFQGEAPCETVFGDHLDSQLHLQGLGNRVDVSKNVVMTPPVVSPCMRDWLIKVNHGDTNLLQYGEVLTATFGSFDGVVGAIRGLRPSNGVGGLQDYEAFFARGGINKLGHKRLFQNWFNAHGHASSTNAVRELLLDQENASTSIARASSSDEL